ncbi:IS66 family transposase [Sabulicella rubraurantiaca]|uniref:IS66 family transposase n=1 Tax=Sabulicella rubraurantiaca TaxID=2811429 RepID=UPI0038B5C30B
MTQVHMRALLIWRGWPGLGLLAHVLVGKYCDHLPLHRQAEIFAREGLDLPKGIQAGSAGKAATPAERRLGGRPARAAPAARPR